MTTRRSSQAPVTLQDKYVRRSGDVFITGLQAIVRLCLEQRWRDDEAGLRTRVFVSGYPGSPLGGLDAEFRRAARHLDEAGVVFQPGLNEEMAATAVAGTQLLNELDGRLCDGVVGLWYGKNPGLDRAADAIRHGNLGGTDPDGGSVALIGDDPGCKSSTIPSACEVMCESLRVPLLTPSSVHEIVPYGLHAIAMSRQSGLWTALKIVADLADSAATVTVGPPLAVPGLSPRPRVSHVLLPPSSLDAEADLARTRMTAVEEYATRARLNHVVFEPERPLRAIAAGGTTFLLVRQALEELGCDDSALDARGIRLIKIGLSWPMPPGVSRDLAADVGEFLVIEEKVSFIERQLKEALYGCDHQPVIEGKRDRSGAELVPDAGQLSTAQVRAVLARWLGEAAGAGPRQPPRERLLPISVRTPFFCSGCPHNSSTRAPEGTLVGPGIGCHALIGLRPHGRGRLIGSPQMGGEGGQWLGLHRFTSDRHFAQNLGDGTFFHSGSLAVRAAVAAGVNITFKLLVNGAIAMTGGQTPEGGMSVPALAWLLDAEGVRQTIVVTPAAAEFDEARLPRNASVRPRADVLTVQEELAAVSGTTVLIYADDCAAQERRDRRRGTRETPSRRIWINERVCEGCGDCGAKSTCLSVVPVDTEFGRKTRIHQSSCNFDYSCVSGDCPAFVQVDVVEEIQTAPTVPWPLPDPVPRCDLRRRHVLIRMPGIGGTGVVTSSQILQMAAHLDGLQAGGLDQTGLAQKGGAVISDVRIAASGPVVGIRASEAEVDLLLGLDIYGAAQPGTLRTASARRTIAVLNVAQVATVDTVADPAVSLSPVPLAIAAVEKVTKNGENVYLDAERIALRLFGDHMLTNSVLLGAAFQHGCLPLSAASIEEAMRLNGVDVEKNVSAFRWGRAAIARPDDAESRFAPAAAAAPAAADAVAVACAGLPARVVRLASDLERYQDRSYALEFARRVQRVSARFAVRLDPPDAAALTEAFACGLHKLLAYKDEYEVAALHLDTLPAVRAEFGSSASAKVLLHPPVLRALGLRRKIGFGSRAALALRVLRSMRRVRGRWYDPFGHTEIRRLERALPGEYEDLVTRVSAIIEPATLPIIRGVVDLPDIVRGYEEIKLANVARFRAAAREHLASLAGKA